MYHLKDLLMEWEKFKDNNWWRVSNSIHAEEELLNDFQRYSERNQRHLPQKPLKGTITGITPKRHLTRKKFLEKLNVSEVIQNGRTTIVKLNDGRKGVSTCAERDTQDFEVGFAIAYILAISTDGNKTMYKNMMKSIKRKINKRK